MKLKILLVTTLVLFAYSLALTEDEQEWKEYKDKFNKTYDAKEDAQRFEVFKKTLKNNREHNKKFKEGEVGWERGLNQFSDWTNDELKNIHGFQQPQN